MTYLFRLFSFWTPFALVCILLSVHTLTIYWFPHSDVVRRRESSDKPGTQQGFTVTRVRLQICYALDVVVYYTKFRRPSKMKRRRILRVFIRVIRWHLFTTNTKTKYFTIRYCAKCLVMYISWSSHQFHKGFYQTQPVSERPIFLQINARLSIKIINIIVS